MTRREILKQNARNLRNHATREEEILWYEFLKKQTPQWYRQMVLGDYIADFYCRKMKLVIELDGSQHFAEDHMEYDTIRTEYLNSMGIEVLRFTNTDIKKNLQSVCDAITRKVQERANVLSASR